MGGKTKEEEKEKVDRGLKMEWTEENCFLSSVFHLFGENWLNGSDKSDDGMDHLASFLLFLIIGFISLISQALIG